MDLNNFKKFLIQNKEIIILLSIFILLYSFNLDKFPRVWTDEAWFSNPAYALITLGKLGTTMKAGTIANYTYWQPPVYLLLLAGSFKLFGFGLTQARMVSVFLGFLTVLFTYLLGKRLYNKRIGLLASLLLIANPLFFYTSRQVRMDIAVACFTLIALYYIYIALKDSKPVFYFISSFFAMLALLSHPNGLMGIIAIVLIILVYKVDLKGFKFNLKLKEIIFFISGIILPLVPYLYYISLDFPEFKGQFMSNIGGSPSNPLMNIISEPTRYTLVLTYFNGIEGILLKFMLATGIILTIWGLIYILKDRRFSEKFLMIILLTHLILLTVVVSDKLNFWYLTMILPYWMILIVLPFKNKINFKDKGLKSTFLKLLLITFLIANSFGIYHILSTSNGYNYLQIENEVQKYIPEGSVVVGEPAYWIALQNKYIYYDHYGANLTYFDEWNVQYILYDYYWNNSDLNSDTAISIKEYIKQNTTLIGTIPYSPDLGLGPIKIYKVNKY
jgi:4-amino-4-deoxy-L-arabinose transferase-like glycosyltransferase